MRAVQDLQKLCLKTEGFVKNNAPTILTCIGTVGVVATAVTTAKATIKAIDILEQAEKKKGEKLTTIEKVQVAAPVYISPILLGVGSISCFFGANVLNLRKQASLISAYTVLDQSYKEYKNKVNELYGENADFKVRNEIAKEKQPRQR